MDTGKFVVGTRYFEDKPENAASGRAKLGAFIENALSAGAAKVFIAVNALADASGVLFTKPPDGATLFPVMPWGRFVVPLNTILNTARGMLTDHLMLLASAEVKITKEAVQIMASHMTDNTLVVGAALLGHNYSPGMHRNADGFQMPWFTYALANPRILCLTGIPLIGDGPLGDDASAGVEEVATGRVIQALRPEVEIKMVQVPGQNWDTSGFDAERLAAHLKKIATKASRPAAQLRALQMTGPTVIHI